MTMVLLCLLLSSCVSGRKEVIQKAIDENWIRESGHIQKALNLKVGERIRAGAAWMDDGLYIVFVAPHGDEVIVFDLGKSAEHSQYAILNSGHANRQSSGDWTFEAGESSSEYEPNGGVMTFATMMAAIERGVASKPVAIFTSK